MDLPKINLHVHSNFSDGLNSIEQIVSKGLVSEIEYICISDHFSNSWKSKIIPTLDSTTKIANYLREISKCNYYLEENNNHLRLLKGVEIDISSDMDYILRLINPKKFDLILFEYLESYEGIAFISNIINDWISNYNSKDKLALFGLAHLDPSYFYYSNFNRLIDLFTKYHLLYEFNANYPDSYSSKYQPLFQKLKEKGIMFSIGSDSHEIRSLFDLEIPLRMIESYDLQKNYQSLVKKLDSIFSKQL